MIAAGLHMALNLAELLELRDHTLYLRTRAIRIVRQRRHRRPGAAVAVMVGDAEQDQAGRALSAAVVQYDREGFDAMGCCDSRCPVSRILNTIHRVMHNDDYAGIQGGVSSYLRTARATLCSMTILNIEAATVPARLRISRQVAGIDQAHMAQRLGVRGAPQRSRIGSAACLSRLSRNLLPGRGKYDSPSIS